jgi:hypothetical protein
MFDAKKFIMEIKGNSSFWGNGNSGYQNREKNDLGEVRKIMCDEWES